MSANVEVCEIDEDLLKKIKKFRLRKEKNTAAIIMKINPETLTVLLDEEHEDIDDLDEFREELPASQPRYVLYSGIREHDDGRVSYPLMFIFVSPQGCKPELHMMYAGSKNSLVQKAGLTKVFEIRSVEELTEEWILEKLKFFS